MNAVSTIPSPAGLLIVDPQKAFSRVAPPGFWDSIAKLAAGFTHLGLSQFVNHEDSIVWRYKHWKKLQRGSPGSELLWDPGTLNPNAQTIHFEKDGFTAATPGFVEWVKKAGLKEVYLCGGEIDLCIMRTAIGLMEAGIRPLVLVNYCYTPAGPEVYRYAVIQAKRYLGKPQVFEGMLTRPGEGKG